MKNMDRKLNKRFAICFPSGNILFTTNDEQIALNRKEFGWTIVCLNKDVQSLKGGDRVSPDRLVNL